MQGQTRSAIFPPPTNSAPYIFSISTFPQDFATDIFPLLYICVQVERTRGRWNFLRANFIILLQLFLFSYFLEFSYITVIFILSFSFWFQVLILHSRINTVYLLQSSSRIIVILQDYHSNFDSRFFCN